MEWLKKTAQEIQRMELDRSRSIMNKDFYKATSLLKAIKFARAEFSRESKKYAKK